MKRIFILLAAAVCCLATTAQVRFGLKAGIGLNSLNLSNHTVQELACKDNCTGFTGGLLVEWETPVVGLCFDGALQYARRTNDLTKNDHWFKRDYIDIPINLKWKMVIPSIADKFRPFLFTGPDFAILVSKRKGDGLGSRFSSLSTAWNFGAGFEICRHFQISAAYGLGLNKSIKDVITLTADGKAEEAVDGTDRFWTISAAYLF